jgi:hypothetical protein
MPRGEHGNVPVALPHVLTQCQELKAAGAESVLEFRYDRDVERAHGLPKSRPQVAFGDRYGHRGRRDREYEKYGVVIELDGKLAHPLDARWRDKDRDNAAAADGKQSLRYGWVHVRRQACSTAAQVAKVLRRHGWEGRLRRCSPVCSAQREFSG